MAFGDELDSEQPILVVVEMNGGNDGLNTVVPYKQREYQRYRRRTRIDKGQVLKLDDQNGLNPAMPGFKQLFDDGALAVRVLRRAAPFAREADEVGQKISASAGWNPEGLTSLLKSLGREEELRSDEERRGSVPPVAHAGRHAVPSPAGPAPMIR